MLKAILLAISVGGLLYGLGIYLTAETSIHQIAGLVALIIPTIAFSALAVVDKIQGTQTWNLFATRLQLPR